MNRTRKGAESGQATLELALGLPILALLLAGLVEVGLVAGDQARLWHAAREAARIAVVDPDSSDVQAAAERGGLKPLRVEISPAAAERRQGDPLTVSLTYEPAARVPVFGTLLQRVALSAEATMRIEQP